MRPLLGTPASHRAPDSNCTLPSSESFCKMARCEIAATVTTRNGGCLRKVQTRAIETSNSRFLPFLFSYHNANAAQQRYVRAFPTNERGFIDVAVEEKGTTRSRPASSIPLPFPSPVNTLLPLSHFTRQPRKSVRVFEIRGDLVVALFLSRHIVGYLLLLRWHVLAVEFRSRENLLCCYYFVGSLGLWIGRDQVVGMGGVRCAGGPSSCCISEERNEKRVLLFGVLTAWLGVFLL